jgi:hypothetical protein
MGESSIMHPFLPALVAALLLCTLHFCGGFGLAAFLMGRHARRRDDAMAAEHAEMQNTIIQLSKSLDACHDLVIRQLQSVQTVVDCEVKQLAKGMDQNASRRLSDAAEELRKSSEQLRSVLETSRNSAVVVAVRPGRPSARQDAVPPWPGLPSSAPSGEKNDWLDTKCSQRVVYRCTQRFAPWDGTSVPPLERFCTMQCLEISTKEIVFDCEFVQEEGEVLIGLETAQAGLVLLRAVIMQRHALNGSNQLRFRYLCRLVERLEPSSVPQTKVGVSRNNTAQETRA